MTKKSLISIFIFALFINNCNHQWQWFLDMHISPAIDNQELDVFGSNDSGVERNGNRFPPAGTVPYKGSLYRLNPLEVGYPGTPNSEKLVKGNLKKPASVDIKKGKKQYEIYCGVCHGKKGYADGVIAKDASYGLATLIKKLAKKNPNDDVRAVNYSEELLFHYITVGAGAMRPYGAQITEKNRWNIAAYIKQELQK